VKEGFSGEDLPLLHPSFQLWAVGGTTNQPGIEGRKKTVGSTTVKNGDGERTKLSNPEGRRERLFKWVKGGEAWGSPFMGKK